MFTQLSATRSPRHRQGKVLVLLALLLPSALGIVGLVIDGGLIMVEHRKAQHAADAAAMAAAMALERGKNVSSASHVATEVVWSGHGMAGATVNVNIPPASGDYAGEVGYVEVAVVADYQSRFFKILDGVLTHQVEGRAVAGAVPAQVGAAIVVLDPNPEHLDISNLTGDLDELDPIPLSDAAISQSGITGFLASLPVVGPLAAQLLGSTLDNAIPPEITDALDQAVQSLPIGPPPSLLAGLEVEGLGSLRVDGAIYVNSEWGQVDQGGKLIGCGPGPPYGMACMPILPLTRVRARDIRLVGGVDNEKCYGPFEPGGPNPLQAGRTPVADPFQHLPVPSEISDPDNVVSTQQSPSHAVRVALPVAQVNGLLNNLLTLLPLLNSHRNNLRSLLTQPTLSPGVYDSLTVISPLGGARLEPGIYVIRGKNPHTKLSLCLIGPVQAEGVMFYITRSADFDVATGMPDAGQSVDEVPAHTIGTLVPSVVIAPLLPGGKITGLQDPDSPFHNMLIYQQRHDRRPIVVEAQHLLGGGSLSGTIYSKWSHLLFVAGAGSYDLRFVSGTLRVVTVTSTTIAPLELLPATKDVLLVE